MELVVTSCSGVKFKYKNCLRIESLKTNSNKNLFLKYLIIILNTIYSDNTSKLIFNVNTPTNNFVIVK